MVGGTDIPVRGDAPVAKTIASIRPTSASSEVIVIGAGGWGSFTALNLRQRGMKVTLVDAYGPGNARSTSGDETRGVRSSYGDRPGTQGEVWTLWARDAMKKWIAFDDEWGRHFRLNLFHTTGDLILRSEWDNFQLRTKVWWDKNKIPYQILNPDDVRKAFPVISMDDITAVIYEPDAGVVRARRAAQAAASAFEVLGGKIVIGRATPGKVSNGRPRGSAARHRRDAPRRHVRVRGWTVDGQDFSRNCWRRRRARRSVTSATSGHRSTTNDSRSPIFRASTFRASPDGPRCLSTIAGFECAAPSAPRRRLALPPRQARRAERARRAQRVRGAAILRRLAQAAATAAGGWHRPRRRWRRWRRARRWRSRRRWRWWWPRRPAGGRSADTTRSRHERPLGRRDAGRRLAAFCRAPLSAAQGCADLADPLLPLRVDVERKLHRRPAPANVQCVDRRRRKLRGIQDVSRRRRVRSAAHHRSPRRPGAREGLQDSREGVRTAGSATAGGQHAACGAAAAGG